MLEHLAEPDVWLQVVERDALRPRPVADVVVGHAGVSFDHLVELKLEARGKVGQRCRGWKNVSRLSSFRRAL